MKNESGNNKQRRWLPNQGEPEFILERISQMLVKAAAWLPFYTSLIVTLTLLLVIFGVPFIGGR